MSRPSELPGATPFGDALPDAAGQSARQGDAASVRGASRSMERVRPGGRPGRRRAGGSGVAAHLDMGADWQRVSHRYVVVLIVGTIVWGLAGAVVGLVLWLGFGLWWAWMLVAADVAAAIAMLVIAPRRAHSIGYQLREDDLLFCHGILFQRYVAVPYGRMQLIDINRGPIGRILHLADLRFVTAAASTGVGIPGLHDDTAAGLRDRLVALAETRRAGL